MRDLCTQEFLKHQRVGRRRDPLVTAKMPAGFSSVAPAGGPQTDYVADAHQSSAGSAGRTPSLAGGSLSWLWLFALGGGCLAVALAARWCL